MPVFKSKLLSHMLLTALIASGFVTAFTPNQCLAQLPQMAVAGQADMIRQLKETGSYFKEWGRKHDHFPNNVNEMDEALQALYKRINLTEVDTRVQVASNGKYRTFYQFNIAVDPSWKTIPIVNGIPQMPSGFTGPAFGIVILTDGSDEVVCLATDGGGNVITADGANPYYQYEKIEPKDSSPSSNSNSSAR